MATIDEATIIENAYQLPCPSCGSQLRYSAEDKKISCGHCGYLEDIDDCNDKVVEKSLADAVNQVSSYTPEDLGKKVFDCGNCGSKFMVEADKIKVNCGFCGSRNVNVEAYDHNLIQPIGIIPFYISRGEAEKRFVRWINKGFFHPSKLKRMAAIEDLHGIYIPFWTYDAQSESQWSGEAGHYHTRTMRVAVNGKMQTQQVQEVRWQRRSGHLSHFLDDVLVVASAQLEQLHMRRILPYRLEEVVNFDPRLMIGWEAEVYSVEVDEGYQKAEIAMDQIIRQMCSAQLGGETQRNLHIRSQKTKQTFKHIILPVWLASYTYQDKVYHFTINGQTGKVYGQKPKSWIKIIATIIIVALLFAAFMYGVYYLRESGALRK